MSVCYGKAQPIKARIVAEIREVMTEARKAGISPAAISAEALSELKVRHDPETARGLHVEFVGGSDDDLLIDLVRV